MKRFRLLLVAVLMATTLCIFVFASLASAAPARHCTAHWHIASSAPINNSVDGGSIGTVSLLRDGCGNIQAKLHPAIANAASFYVYLVDAHNNTIGVESSGTGTQDIKTATYHHYSGVSVSAVGTITQVAGASPTISVGQTPYNSGK